MTQLCILYLALNFNAWFDFKQTNIKMAANKNICFFKYYRYIRRNIIDILNSCTNKSQHNMKQLPAPWGHKYP